MSAPAIIHRPSPNFEPRKIPGAPRFIVLHYTGMPTGEAALERMCDPKAEVSAHYVLEEDGRVYQLVDEAMRAWHAGKSFWGGVEDINSVSLGVELVNPGHRYGYRSFPPAQIAALKELLGDIVKRHGMNPALALLGHADVAPLRKDDPGELFPWRELADSGFGLWPQPEKADYGFADDGEVQQLLRAIGYDCPESGGYDRAMRAAILAFQRHYHPENLTGTPEAETVARLRALKRITEKAAAGFRRAG